MEETVTILKSEYDMLKARLAALEQELSLLKSGRSSRTSSTPPSHDIGRSNGNSLRSKSGRKLGGQCGHEGHTLSMSDHPDEVIEHAAG